MSDFDFGSAKKQIAEIVAVTETVPEPLREKCFELLFGAVFSGQAPPFSAERLTPDKPDLAPPQDEPPQSREGKKLPPNVLAFARRQNVSPEELGKLFLLDHEPLLPIYKLPQGKTSQAQLYKVMMVLLENGLLNNSLSAPYSELRENVREDGLFDGNFNGLLKRNHALFKGAITKDSIKETEPIELTGAGMEKLAAIIKEMSQS